MRKFSKVLLLVLLMALFATTAMAYVSDRYDFGHVDFGGATITFVACGILWSNLKKEENLGSSGRSKRIVQYRWI